AAQAAVTEAVSPNERLQLRIQPWSSYVIVPVFVLANAGVVLTGETLAAAFTSPVTWGIIVGLTVGKLVGVSAGTWVALRTGLGRVPDTLRWGQLIGGAGLAGIGFTVALFVTELALDDEQLITDAKIGILAGSILAALIGWLVFRLAGERGGQCAPTGLPVLPPRPWRPPEWRRARSRRSGQAAERVGPAEVRVVRAQRAGLARAGGARLEPHRDPPVPRALHPPVPVLGVGDVVARPPRALGGPVVRARSEEHTSELQSRENLV